MHAEDRSQNAHETPPFRQKLNTGANESTKRGGKISKSSHNSSLAALPFFSKQWLTMRLGDFGLHREGDSEEVSGTP